MATINAVSCSFVHVQAAIALASNGDTVSVPAGSATWNSKLTVTKWINIIGAGSANTIITGGWNSPYDYLVTFDPPDLPTNGRFRLSGFKVTCSLSGVFDTGIYDPTYKTFFRVDHNNFIRTDGSRVMNLQTTSRGCIDSNELHGHFYCISIYGNQELNWLNTTFTPGTADNIFVEDNVMYGDDGYHAGGQGGRYCIRHNTYHFLSTYGGLHPAFDVHGNQSDGNMGAMGAEIYENTIDMPGGESCTMVDLRGGECIVFNNTVTSTGSVGFQIREQYHDNCVNVPSGSYPVAAPDGMPAHISDSYFWHNYWNTTLMVPPDIMYVNEEIDYTDTGVPGYRVDMAYKGLVPRENVHYWRENTAFNGSVGIGVGLFSARPSSGLTIGVGYWATDMQTLYRATGATTWEAYYTPYTYPHPERGEAVQTYTLGIVPTSRTVSKGAIASYEVTVNADDGFTNNVTLGVAGLPVGTTPTFETNPLGPDETTTMEIDTDAIAPGTLNLKVTGEEI